MSNRWDEVPDETLEEIGAEYAAPEPRRQSQIGTPWKGLTAELREAEKDVAAELQKDAGKAGRMQPEDWERIRQWPGEFHNKEEAEE